MNFALFNNQHGTLVLQAVDANGNPQPLPSDLTVSSSSSSQLDVAPVTGTPGSFIVTAHEDGTPTLTATGTNAAGASISTQFNFTLTDPTVPNPAVGFTATLVDVANN